MDNIRYGPKYSFDEELCNTIIEQFTIGPIIATKDLGGTYNLNILLETTLGRYIIRVYRPWVTFERLNMLQQVKQVLHSHTVPVILPIANKSGETILSYQGRYVEVERFVPHDEVTETWQRYEVAFSLLARLHTCFATQFKHIPIVPPMVSNYGTPDVLLAWTLRAEQRIRQVKDDENAPIALALCDSTIQLLAVMQGWWNETGYTLPQQMTHGDYGTGNLLFQDERVVAILDFDFLAVRERIFDIAYILCWMFRRIESESPPDKHSWFRVGDMLKWYNSASAQPLTEMEIRALPLEMARVPLYWIAEAHLLPNPPHAIVQLADTVQYSCWVLEHQNELADLFVL